MKKKYHAIPVLIYAPVDVYPDSIDAQNMIHTLMTAEEGEFPVLFAEDYFDGKVEIDEKEELDARISYVCLPNHTKL